MFGLSGRGEQGWSDTPARSDATLGGTVNAPRTTAANICLIHGQEIISNI